MSRASASRASDWSIVITVRDGTLISNELLVPRHPVVKVEVYHTQDEFELAITFLLRIHIHDIDLRRNTVIVVAWLDEAHSVVVHHGDM